MTSSAKETQKQLVFHFRSKNKTRGILCVGFGWCDTITGNGNRTSYHVICHPPPDPVALGTVWCQPVLVLLLTRRLTKRRRRSRCRICTRNCRDGTLGHGASLVHRHTAPQLVQAPQQVPLFPIKAILMVHVLTILLLQTLKGEREKGISS